MSEKSKVIYMPLYVADYLVDTSHLTAEQSGAYLHLMMHQFITGELPSCEKQLARIAKLPGRLWQKNRDVLQKLFVVESNSWSQNRVKKERVKALDKIQKAKENGNKGGRPAKKAKPPGSVPVKRNESYSESELEVDPTSNITGGIKSATPPLRLDGISREMLLSEFSAEIVSHYEDLCASQAADSGINTHNFAARVKTFMLRDRAESRGMFKPLPQSQFQKPEADRSRAAERKIFKADRKAPKAVAGLVSNVLRAK